MVTWLGLIGSLKLGNVWVSVQLIFCPLWPMNHLNKTQTFPNLRLPISPGLDILESWKNFTWSLHLLIWWAVYNTNYPHIIAGQLPCPHEVELEEIQGVQECSGTHGHRSLWLMNTCSLQHHAVILQILTNRQVSHSLYTELFQLVSWSNSRQH